MTPRWEPRYVIGQAGGLEQVESAAEVYDGDPRGFVLCSEPPNPRRTYKMGVDPTNGITGWSRYSRTPKDKFTNNGAIEVFREGVWLHDKEGNPYRTPDVQVCEYAGPLDPLELGFVANLIGRLYAGQDEDQCQCILEVYPGPGGLTMRQMVELGYVNFWKWQKYADLAISESANSVGWSANVKTVRDLWTKCSRHVILGQVEIVSPFLVDEMGDARMDPVKHYAVSPNSERGHGDRMRAAFLALWAANGWDLDVERTTEVVRTQMKQPEWAHTDMSAEEVYEAWGEAVGRFLG